MAVTVTNYDTVNGKIRTKWTGERPGSQAVFHDPLGSVVGIYEDGWLKADRVYDASGETRAEWNDVGTFGWVGGYGYRETRREWVSHYVRARHYSYMTGGWTSLDPLWPGEMAYQYVEGQVCSVIDPTGTAICFRTSKSRRCTKPEQKGPGQALCDQVARQKGQTKLKIVKCSSVEVTETCVSCFGWNKRTWVYIVASCASSPFGDCSPWRHKSLQDEVEAKCKGKDAPRSCNNIAMTTCDEFRENMRKFAKCAGARARINMECYRGGDFGHNVAFSEAMAGFLRCKDRLDNHKPPC